MAERNLTAPQVVDPLERQIDDKCETPVETLTEVKCDTHELETMISSLGEIVEVPVVSVPHYATFHSSVVATGKEGSDPGELHAPRGVANHEDTHQIFVANQLKHRVEIFSETGEFLYQLGVGQLSEPCGITTHGDSLYISCTGDHTVSKFSLTEMWCVNHLRNITHESMSRPLDVKVSRDCLYVLCTTNPCMLVLTLEGDKLHSLITRGEGMDVLSPFFFCFDSLNNFVISDCDSNSIRVFSPEGNLLHTIGRRGHQPGMFYDPRGVVVTPNRRLVCVSSNENSGLQIFC